MLKETIENLGTILFIPIIAIVGSILVILITIERKLSKKIKIIEKDKNSPYIKKIKRINKTDPKDTLKDINKIAIGFFIERFKIKYVAEYSELEDFFNGQNNKEVAEFCNLMDSSLYSKKRPDKKTNQKLILSLMNIIKNNPTLNKEKLKKPQKFWQRVKIFMFKKHKNKEEKLQ